MIPKCFSRFLGTSQVILDFSEKEWNLNCYFDYPAFDDKNSLPGTPDSLPGDDAK